MEHGKILLFLFSQLAHMHPRQTYWELPLKVWGLDSLQNPCRNLTCLSHNISNHFSALNFREYHGSGLHRGTDGRWYQWAGRRLTHLWKSEKAGTQVLQCANYQSVQITSTSHNQQRNENTTEPYMSLLLQPIKSCGPSSIAKSENY